MVLEAATAGTSAGIVDPEGEYERLVRWLGGDYLEIAPGRCGSLNVFDPARPGAEGLADAAANVVDLISVLAGGGLSELDRAHVDNAVRLAQTAAEREERQALLGDCLPFLEESQPGLTIVLRRFCEGPLGALFNRPTSIQLEAGVVGLSLRELKSEFVPAATLVIAQWLWRLVQRGRRARHLVFDEVGMLAAHPTLRTLLVQLARRCRKYAASLVVATQNVQDLLQSDEGTVVATNCGIVLLGGHRPAETARMERAFGLTDAQRRFLENAGRGEFLLLAGNQRLEIRVQVPELHRMLLDPLEAD
jgi:type IV secretory pathway VirB4 component